MNGDPFSSGLVWFALGVFVAIMVAFFFFVISRSRC